jgi:hypothetical protein
MSVVMVLGQSGYPDAYGPSSTVSAFGSFDSTGFGGELYPYDTHYPWVHGYFQEIPAYGGYVAFKPYNYKHVLSQSQAAGGWGLNPTIPYSQQFWHRYHQRATMSMDHAPVQDYPQHTLPVVPMRDHFPPLAPPAPSYPQLFQN